MTRSAGILMLLVPLSGCISYNPESHLANNQDLHGSKAPAVPSPSVPVWAKAQVPAHYQRDDFSRSRPGASASGAGLPASGRPDPQPDPLPPVMVGPGPSPDVALTGSNAWPKEGFAGQRLADKSPDMALTAPTSSAPDSIVLAAASSPVPDHLVTPGLFLMSTAAPGPVQTLKPPPAPALAVSSAFASAPPTASGAALADPAKARPGPVTQGSNPVVPTDEKTYRVPPMMCVVDNKCITLNLDVRDLGPTCQAGADSQVWVMVDPARPQVQLTEVTPGLNGKVPTVTIQWKASDKDLGRQPVSLSYAASEEGPWQPIATNLDSVGRFVWRVPPWAPSKFYIRAEATNVAGKVGMDQTHQPLLLGTATPYR